MRCKKIVLVALALVAAASLFAGCGNQSNSASQEKKEITVGVTPGASEQIMNKIIRLFWNWYVLRENI